MEDKKKYGRNLPNGEKWDNKAWRAVRKRALESKDPYCAICGRWIDIELPAFQPLSCEVDHIIPISRGGAPYEISNLQLTHLKCNRQKGAKIEGEGEKIETPFPVSNSW